MSHSRPDNPAGDYVADPRPSAVRRAELISEIEYLPARLEQLVDGLTAEHLNTKYRNWTIRQIVHHLADSHLNGYIRTKLTLTEERPTIKPYDESKWSQLPDIVHTDINASFKILAGVHARWAATFQAMTADEFDREYIHPEYQRAFRLAEQLGLYAWHGRHHSEMIAWLRKEHGWN